MVECRGDREKRNDRSLAPLKKGDFSGGQTAPAPRARRTAIYEFDAGMWRNEAMKLAIRDQER